MATTVVEPRLPDTKEACQRLLRSFDYRGYKIDTIEQPTALDPEPVGRVYVLTRKVYVGPDQWRRRAKTIVFHFGESEVRTEELEGWVVADE